MLAGRDGKPPRLACSECDCRLSSLEAPRGDAREGLLRRRGATCSDARASARIAASSTSPSITSTPTARDHDHSGVTTRPRTTASRAMAGEGELLRVGHPGQLRARASRPVTSRTAARSARAARSRAADARDRVRGTWLGPRRPRSDPTIKFVLDAGNGVGGPMALAAMRKLGPRAPDPLFCEMGRTVPEPSPRPDGIPSEKPWKP